MRAIIASTFKEAVRKKIFMLIGIITFIYLALLYIFLSFSMNELKKNNMDLLIIFKNISLFTAVLGFYFSSMLVTFLSIMTSVGTISSEIENGAIQAVITKPIKRSHFILGKYLGLAILLVLYSCFIYAAIIGICSSIGISVTSTFGLIPILKGLLLFILQPLVILSLSFFGGVIFKTITNGIFVMAIYILGLIGGMMEQIGSMISNDILIKWGIFLSLISPADTLYREMISTIFSNVGFEMPLFGAATQSNMTPSIWMNVYIAIYTLGLLFLAVWKFRKKDIS